MLLNKIAVTNAYKALMMEAKKSNKLLDRIEKVEASIKNLSGQPGGTIWATVEVLKIRDRKYNKQFDKYKKIESLLLHAELKQASRRDHRERRRNLGIK